MKKIKVAVDIGNSNVVIGLYVDGKWEKIYRLSSRKNITYWTFKNKLQKNGERKHYMRAYFDYKTHSISVKSWQDSSLLSILADSNALVIREPNAAALKEGQCVSTILLK